MRRWILMALVAGLAGLGACEEQGWVDSDSFDPMVTTRGSDFVVAYRYEPYDGTGRAEIRMCRVDEDGGLLAPPSVVRDGEGRAHYPALDWSGSEHLIAWIQQSEPDRGIYAARVDGEGQVVAPAERLVDAIILGADENTRPSVLWTGQEWMVVWGHPEGGGYSIRAARLDEDGARVADDVVLSGAGEATPRTLARWTGAEGALVLSESNGDAVGSTSLLRFDAEGATPEAFDLGEVVVRSASLAYGEGTYGVAWEGSTEGGLSEVFFTVAPQGGSAPTAIQLSDSSLAYSAGSSGSSGGGDVAHGSWRPAVVWDGARFLVLWAGTHPDTWTRTAVMAAAISADGEALEPATEVLAEAAGTAGDMGLGWGPGGLGLAWYGAGKVAFASGPMDDLVRRF